MNIRLHPNIKKNLNKLRAGEKERFFDRIRIFQNNPYDKMLNTHHLKGAWDGYFSINIGGDLRAVYCLVDKDTAIFVAVGTHHQLYKK